MRANENASFYPEFAWLVVTMSNIFCRSVLRLTPLQFADSCLSCFEISVAARPCLLLLSFPSLEE